MSYCLQCYSYTCLCFVPCYVVLAVVLFLYGYMLCTCYVVLAVVLFLYVFMLCTCYVVLAVVLFLYGFMLTKLILLYRTGYSDIPIRNVTSIYRLKHNYVQVYKVIRTLLIPAFLTSLFIYFPSQMYACMYISFNPQYVCVCVCAWIATNTCLNL